MNRLLLEEFMKKTNYYFISFLMLLILVAGLNFLVELNAYTPHANQVDTLVMEQSSDLINIADYPVTLFTLEERCVDDDHQQMVCHELNDIQNGDILITKSNHTLLYRHGHAGLVVDVEAGLVLEAIGYGTKSRLEPLEKWNYYPTVKVLRLKEKNETLISSLIDSALSNFLDINYNLLASKYNLKVTHCSDIVWKVFNSIGIDLDSNGGWIVTPKDISQSPYLYEVKSFGFSPHRVW